SELDFADSTALGAMLQLATALPEGAAVVGAKGPLAKILSIMGLTDQLPMFCTMDEAQHKLHAA
ncbi:MAG TPA: hypothetical protein VM470_03810, partial [Acidimicrobiia bacterium]|nr:hypothetical protein [Acidimicrobiia bacterium]